MSQRVRQHVNPFSLRHLHTGAGPLGLQKGRWTEIDLGCAEGDFLFERAKNRPDGYYVGVEIRKVLSDRINQRAAADGYPQVTAVYANLLTDLDHLLPDRCADMVHVLFPDPWFKRRHRKRRPITEKLALQIARILKPSGHLFFQSDRFDLALETLSTLELHDDLFANLSGSWRFVKENPLGSRSRRERYCLRSGATVWRLLFKRTQKLLSSHHP